MILVGNQRGGAKDLALHLLKRENDRVEVHELRGFAGDTLIQALQESYALSRGTKCKQHMFSLSLNPPQEARVERDIFEKTVDRIEHSLGLDGQPRAIVFHEKNGRRHAHAVWCRIDAEKMRAVPLPYTKNKLQNIARELYIEYDWQMPRGFIDREFRDPRNFTLEEWQQAKRAERDPKQLKGLFQDCWAISDSKETFAHALRDRGFILAKGDRRSFVAVDHSGEVFSVPRWIGIKTGQVKDRLGSPDNLPSVEQAHVQAARMITTRLDELKVEQIDQQKHEAAALETDNEKLIQRQASQRQALADDQAERAKAEDAERQSRLRTGLFGFLDRLTGKRKKIEAEIRSAALTAAKRDDREREAQKKQHSDEQARFSKKVQSAADQRNEAIQELSSDINALRQKARERLNEIEQASDRHQRQDRPRRRNRSRDGPRRSR